MREIFIERRKKLLRIALKENNKLSECFIEEDVNHQAICGEIYKGIITNIIPGIKCAFVDIGYEKQGYMVVNQSENNLKKGDEVIVEVIKEQYGDKGAKLSDKFSLAGRYVVFTKDKKGILFSRKIQNKDFITSIKKEIPLIEDIKITVRTNAENISIEDIKIEIDDLNLKLKKIEKEAKYSLKAKKLYDENTIMHKTLRDYINSETKNIVVDNEKDYLLVKEFLKNEQNIEAILHKEKRSIFDYYGIEKEILSIRNNKVNLKCGGNIVIEKTEAMYVVDVNSNKNINGRNSEKNAEETNKEAAIEISRQIRLRNLSGIILVDFIDMKNKETKDLVINTLTRELRYDKRKSIVYPFTELNLVQIARNRRGKSIYYYIEEVCKKCSGNGKRLKLSYIYMLIKNEIIKVQGESSIKDFYIEINKDYEEDVRNNLFEFLSQINGIDKNIYLNFLDTSEYFKVEPLIFKNQVENVKQYKITNIEKY